MREGWYKDVYLILFDEAEVAAAPDRYHISRILPGYQILGLCGWDNFIVRDSEGHTCSIPTVVPDLRHLSAFVLPDYQTVLRDDDRFTGKIKWHVKPILFGGSPHLSENVTWVSHEQHASLVSWWNEKYRQLKAQESK